MGLVSLLAAAAIRLTTEDPADAEPITSQVADARYPSMSMISAARE